MDNKELKVNEFGTENLVKAIKKCSESTKDEVIDNYRDIMSEKG